MLFGQNIGTCVTALLASIGTNRNARRTTIIHISFNVIGTIVFTTLCIITPLISIVQGWTPDNAPAQIANLHTTFNIVTTLLLLPVGNLLATFSEKILKDKDDEEKKVSVHYLQNLDINEDMLGISAIGMDASKKEIMRMLEMSKENVHKAFDVFKTQDTVLLSDVEERERYIDYLNKEISKFISRVITHERNESGSRIFSSYFAITSNVERIGDHAINIAGYSNMVREKGIKFSETAQSEIDEMQKTCDILMNLLFKEDEDVIGWHKDVACLEQRIDDMTKEYRNNMFERIQKGTCSDEGSVLFSEMLTDFERIGDHALNISEEIMKIRIGFPG